MWAQLWSLTRCLEPVRAVPRPRPPPGGRCSALRDVAISAVAPPSPRQVPITAPANEARSRRCPLPGRGGRPGSFFVVGCGRVRVRELVVGGGPSRRARAGARGSVLENDLASDHKPQSPCKHLPDRRSPRTRTRTRTPSRPPIHTHDLLCATPSPKANLWSRYRLPLTPDRDRSDPPTRCRAALRFRRCAHLGRTRQRQSGGCPHWPPS